jgi:hypothetical protein
LSVSTVTLQEGGIVIVGYIQRKKLYNTSLEDFSGLEILVQEGQEFSTDTE